MSQSVDVLQKSQVDDDLRSSDFFPRSDNFLLQISCLWYPSSLMLWGHAVTHNSRHHHIMRVKTSKIASNPQNVNLVLGQDSYFHT